MSDPTGKPVGSLLIWYVNFELPLQRTTLGVDTFDRLLDLVIDADVSHHRWKDEDEYAHARRLGVITDQVHVHVDRARDQVIALAQTQREPFAQDWCSWQAPDHWSPPGSTDVTLPGRCQATTTTTTLR